MVAPPDRNKRIGDDWWSCARSCFKFPESRELVYLLLASKTWRKVKCLIYICWVTEVTGEATGVTEISKNGHRARPGIRGSTEWKGWGQEAPKASPAARHVSSKEGERPFFPLSIAKKPFLDALCQISPHSTARNQVTCLRLAPREAEEANASEAFSDSVKTPPFGLENQEEEGRCGDAWRVRSASQREGKF